MLLAAALGVGVSAAGAMSWTGRWRDFALRMPGRIAFGMLPLGIGLTLLAVPWVPAKVLGLLLVAIGDVQFVWQPLWFTPEWYRREHRDG
jgi:hypothetical protein